MSATRMPGFTAEFSASEMRGRYRTTGWTTNQMGGPDFQAGSPRFCPGQLCGDQDVGFTCCTAKPSPGNPRGRPVCCVNPDNPLFPTPYSCCPENDPNCCKGNTGPGPCSGGAPLCGNRCCPEGQICGDSASSGCCTPGPGCPPTGPVPWINYPDLNPFPVASKWLVVECQFADVPTIPAGLDANIRRFLGPTGAGYGNIVDYYHDLSYNKIAFVADFIDWVPAPFKSNELSDNSNRAERVRRCLQAIPANQAPDFNSYYGVVAISNAPDADNSVCYLGQQLMTINGQDYPLACVWLDPNSLWTAFAAHEISHAFGLDHSFDDTSPAPCAGGDPRRGAYCDPWDIMSAMNTYQFTDRNWLVGGLSSAGGPGMSAPNLLRMGWIPTANQRNFELDGGEQTFTLRALSHPQVGEPLVVFLDIGFTPGDGVYTVEYRQGDGWDAGIVNPSPLGPQPPVVARSQGGAVLVHQYGGAPVATLIETVNSGASEPGNTVVLTSPVGPVYHVTVKSIDTRNATATVSIGPGRG